MEESLLAVANRLGYDTSDVDHANFVVTFYHLEDQIFYGNTLDVALA